MPPRKRRQSVQGDDIGKEISESSSACPATSSDIDKDAKLAVKCGDIHAFGDNRVVVGQQCGHDSLTQQEKLKDNTIASSDNSAKQPTRFSTRVVKRPRRDLSPPESPVKKAISGRKSSAPAVTTTPETKGKRQWELWSVEDKDSFFEGLCEYGKDFESIHNLIVTKCRKKGNVLPVTVKNKEQVRHFYYRTWHKISKLIQPVENLKKDIQELYGLISYSVLRKKLRGGVNPNDKNWQKLNELVHHGVATIKIKGKRIRVKTPVCNALKKLNNFEEPIHEPGPKVPEKIRVEFRPRNNAAWQQVQDLSQNPRLRITVRPERNLQSILKFIDRKWKCLRIKSKERLGEKEEVKEELRVYPHKDSVLRSICLSAVEEPVLQYSLNKHNKDPLNASPQSGKRKRDKEGYGSKVVCNSGAPESFEALKSVISDVTKCCGCLSTCRLCLCSEDSGATTRDVTKPCGKDPTVKQCLCKCSGSCDKKGPDYSEDSTDSPVKSESGVLANVINPFGSVCDLDKKSTVESDNKSACNGCSVPVSCLQSARAFSVPELSAIVDGENAMFPDLPPVQDFQDKPSADSPESADMDPAKDDEKIDSESNGELGTKEEAAATRRSVLSSQIKVEQVYKEVMANGWTVNVKETTTMAELYLMFGKDGELRLEYEWVQIKPAVTNLEDTLLLSLNNMLRRLSHLATVEFTDFSKTPGAGTMCQLCGQVQGSKRGKGKEKLGRSKVKAGKDAATQTQVLPPAKKEIPISPAPIAPKDTLFRVPVVGPNLAPGPRPIMTLNSKDILQRTGNIPKPLMRPRKLRAVSRGRSVAGGEIVQRTLLPKASQLVTFFPVVTNSPLPSDKDGISQTIVGHPINGIQSQPVTIANKSAPTSSMAVFDTGQMGTIVTSSSSTTLGMVEMSLSPGGDQTLMKISADQVGSMSDEVLTAAGLSTVPKSSCTTIILPVTNIQGTSYPDPVTTTSTSQSKVSISPPNLSFLDMSLPSLGQGDSQSRFLDLETDTSFSGLLDETRPSLSQMDPGLTTPPIRSRSEQHQSPPQLHSPPVRSLFRSSPNPDNTWLNGEVQDLSLSSFLESPTKAASQTSTALFNNMSLSLFNDSSRDSQSNKIDVDATLQCMMTESSIDYVKKFADLAEQFTKNDADSCSNRKSEVNNASLL